ncbi:TPA: late control D family protein [Yersinia enterocolitica]|nr:late control D family protein [Yersinia enterocolitica]
MMLNTSFSVHYEGRNITADIAEDVLSISYTDNEDGKVDDVSLLLKDDSHKWTGPWMPEKGDLFQAALLPDGMAALHFGQVQVDEISASGPPSVIAIKGVSVPIKSGVRRLLKTRAWEKITYQGIAQKIACCADLAFLFLVDRDDNPHYERVDQTEESDLSFLNRLAQDEGLSLKVTDSQLVVFEQAMFEAKEPVARFTLGEDAIKAWSFNNQSYDVYKSCTCKYRIPKKKKSIHYTYIDPDIEDGLNLKIRKLVANLAEARRKAKAALRRKNRYQYTGNLTLVGDTRLCAGVTIAIGGFGGYDGKYIIEKAIHTLDNNGYTTALELRRVIIGY